MAAIAVKKKILGVKLDSAIKDSLQRRCSERGCNVSDYVRDLISRDIGSPTSEKPIPQASLVVRKDESVIDTTAKAKATHIIDATGPKARITGAVIEGVEWKYCEKCKLYYRKNESGKTVTRTNPFS